MTTTAPTRKLKRSLAARTGRIVVLPEHPNWDEARLAWNLAVDQQPAAVVFPETAQDVIAAVELARAFELRVTAQGTGHNAAPLGPLEDTVLVKTERMRGIEIDPEARIARIDAGVRSVELVEAAAQHGLAPLAGSSPDVGVVGYTLGGGLSWLAASTDSPPATSTRSSSGPPTDDSSAPTANTSPISSGRSAAAAAASGSSPHSSSG